MTSKLTQKWTLPRGWLRFSIIIILVLGIFFRFANLEQKVYSVDEVRSFLRLSGYTSEEFVEQVYDGNIVSVADLQAYQRPNSERDLTDAITALAGNPEHPPLYYLMARFWMHWFKNPVSAKVLAACLGLLALPCIYWLCMELFESSLTGWIAVTLISVSPFHVLLSQAARQYTLWSLITLLSSVVLLRALRLKTKLSWAIYTATIALGLYSHLFFLWVIISHAIYVIFTELWHEKKIFVTYLRSSLAGMLIFTPWIGVLMINYAEFESKTRWASSYKKSLVIMAKYWINNLNSIFLDWRTEPSLKNPIIYLILILVVYSIYCLYSQKEPRVWLFILTLIGVTTLGQVVPDLIWGGRRSILSRYLVPCYLGIEIAVAYLISSKMTETSVIIRRFGNVVFVILISAGVISGTLISEAKAWNMETASAINLQVAPFINEATKPVVISDSNHVFLLPLTYLLDSQVQLQPLKLNLIESVEDKLKITHSFSEVFVYAPSKKLLEAVERSYDRKAEVIVGSFKKYGKRKWLYQIK